MRFLGLLVTAVTAVAARSLQLPSHEALALSNRATTRAKALPKSFKWSSSDLLIAPKIDSRQLASIKDPSIIFYNGVYHVFTSTVTGDNYNMLYLNFTDFSKANSAPFYYLDQSAIGMGYRAAPEVFYFAPQKLWYLIFQDGNAAYSTNKDIGNPAGWSAVKEFYNGTPALIQKGLTEANGYWVDMWVICDSANCHLFSSDDGGRLYRSQTPISQFPNGMSDPVIAKQDTKNNLFEASNVYALDNSTSPTYLMLVECIGASSSSGSQRYFRSWTSTSLSGKWTELAATEANPFMGEANVSWKGKQWTKSISHGELVRTDVDQNLRIPPCGKWQFLYQGLDPNASGSYNALPWRLGLLTQDGC